MLNSSLRLSHNPVLRRIGSNSFSVFEFIHKPRAAQSRSRSTCQDQVRYSSSFYQISLGGSRSRSTRYKDLDLDLLRFKEDVCTFSTSSSLSIFWKMGDQVSQEVQGMEDTTAEERPGKIKLTDAEWKAKLTPEEYSVCRNHGTERAWTGALLDNKQKGVYTCSCCGVELFSSSSKFDSGSGWPSFYDALKDKDVSTLPAVDIKQDNSLGMRRTEVLCGKCSSHLGHVFNDGPQPTNLRYCINSVSLKFKAKNDGSNGGSSSGNNNKNNL